jgi:hypothetical protein
VQTSSRVVKEVMESSELHYGNDGTVLNLLKIIELYTYIVFVHQFPIRK